MSLSRTKVRPVIDFLSETVLALTNCAYSQAAASRLASVERKNVQEPTSW